MGVFWLNYGLYALGKTLGPLPWGIYGQSVPRNSLLYVTNAVGKEAPANAHTITEDEFKDIEGSFWNGLPDPDHMTNLNKNDPGYARMSDFWKEWFENPSQYGTPRGVADDIFRDPSKRSVAEKYGVKSADELVALFQKDKQKAFDICMATGEGYYVTSTSTDGRKLVAGFVPFSNLWNPNITSAGIAGAIMDGADPGSIIKGLRAKGYSDEYIRMAFTEVLASHGTSNPIWNPADWPLDADLYGKKPDGSIDKSASPAYLTYREATWIQVTSTMLKNAGGSIDLSDIDPTLKPITQPGVIQFQVTDYARLARVLERNKIPLGELRGGRDFHIILPRDFIDWLKFNDKDAYNEYMKLPSANSPPPRSLILRFTEWNNNVMNGKYNWVLNSIYTPFWPSKDLYNLGLNPSIFAPNMDSAMLALLVKGDSLAIKFFKRESMTIAELTALNSRAYVTYIDQTLRFMELTAKAGYHNVYQIENQLKTVTDYANTNNDKAAYERGVKAALAHYEALALGFNGVVSRLNAEGLMPCYLPDGTIVQGKTADACTTYTAYCNGYEYDWTTKRFEPKRRDELRKVAAAIPPSAPFWDPDARYGPEALGVPSPPAWTPNSDTVFVWDENVQTYVPLKLPDGVTTGPTVNTYWVTRVGGGSELFDANLGGSPPGGPPWEPTPGTVPGPGVMASILKLSLLQFRSLVQAKGIVNQQQLLSVLSVTNKYRITIYNGVVASFQFGLSAPKLRNPSATLALLGPDYSSYAGLRFSFLSLFGETTVGGVMTDNVLYAVLVAGVAMLLSGVVMTLRGLKKRGR